MKHEATLHWAVTVYRNGEALVVIESNCLSGKAEFSDEDARVIRMAAEHLKSFIGKPSYEQWKSELEPSRATSAT